MSRVNDGVAQSQYPSLKAFHDEVGVTGGDSWDEFYNTYRFGYDPTNLQLGDRMARFWNSPANSIYARATFALDARRTPGVPAAGNTTMDLSSNALRVRNGTTGNAKIVQDGRGGKALQLHSRTDTTARADTPDSAAITVGTKVLGARVYLTLEKYVITGGTYVFGQWRPWLLSITSGLRLALSFSRDGVETLSVLSDGAVGNALPAVDGQPIGIGFDYNPATGVAVFWYSLNGIDWLQLGPEVTTANTGALFDNNTPLRTGPPFSSEGVVGKIHYARMYLDGTLVADFDPSRDASYSSLSWTSATTGETWTITPGGSDNSDATYLPAPSTLGVTRYVYLPGIAGNYLSAPDEAALDITGDIDLRAEISDWAVTGSSQGIFGKSTTGPSGSQYALYIQATTGNLLLSTKSATTFYNDASTAALTSAVAAGTKVWVRATLDADNGSSQHVVRFYTSLDGTVWTQLGTDVTAADAVVIQDTITTLTIGALNSGAANFYSGRVHRAQVRNGIDGPVVFDWSAEDTVTATHSAFTASTGQTVTVNRATSGRKTVVVEAAKWLLGTDDYLEIPDNALLDFGAGDSFTVLAVYRRFATQASYVGVLSKSADISNPALPGYGIRGGATTIRLGVTDGSVGPTVYTAAQTDVFGDINVFAGVQTAANARYGWLDGAVSATETTSLGSFANASALWIGKSVAGSNFDGELYAVYVWREALTAAELAAIAADWGAA